MLYAPGREILTLLPGGHYDFVSGDSIATAEITGIVALLLAKDRGLSISGVNGLLRKNGSLPNAALGKINSVDACAAVTSLVGRGTCTSTENEEHAPVQEPDRRVAH